VYAELLGGGADVEAWRTGLSNWQRWGPGDRLGTLNFITPEKRIAAARQVVVGETVPCSRPLETGAGGDDPIPATHVMVRTRSTDAAADFLALAAHGYATSHVDALVHFSHGGRTYNGYAASRSGPAVAVTPVGVDAIGAGVVSRGVLIDVPAARAVEWLEPGTAVTVDELADTATRSGVSIEPGDVLLVRTGRWQRRAARGAWDTSERMAGLDPRCLPWLHEHGVAMLGCDGISDVLPSLASGSRLPIHEIGLVFLGMPLLDNLDLDALAAACARLQRWEFLFVAAPLLLPNGTASPLNPLAIF
jgi:kynurenine formamidase